VVARCLWLTILMLMPVVGAGAALDIAIEDPRVEMGKYLNVRIVYDGESTVGAADLRQWADDFVIDRRDTDSQSLVDGSVRTTQRLRLYPRSPGEKVLERIALGGTAAGPLHVTVVPTVRDGIDGTPRWLPAPAQVWQGQTFEIGVQLALLHPSNHIAVEDAVFPGFDVLALPREQVPGGAGGVVRLRWRLTATDPGHHAIDLPAVEQRGRGRWRFYLKPAVIVVRPLPSYLPPSVPVGEVSLRSALLQAEGRLVWEVTVSNQGRLPASVYGMRSALAAAARRDADDVVVSAVEDEVGTGRSSQRYRVPVPAWSLGWGDGPSVGLRYFDVGRGQLATLRSSLPATWRLPAVARYGLAGLGIVMAAAVGVAVRRLAGQILARRRLRAKLREAGDAHALRQVLLESGGYATLGEWAANRPVPRAATVAAEINTACFSRAPEAQVAALKGAAWRVLRRA